MDLTNRVTQLEDEIKVLKNEVLAVLLDVKENLLTRENPFTQQPAQNSADRPVININQSLPSHDNAPKTDNDSPSSQAEQSSTESAQSENVTKNNGNGHNHDLPKTNGNGHSDEGRPETSVDNGNQNAHKTTIGDQLRTNTSYGHPLEQFTTQRSSSLIQTLWKNPENGNTEIKQNSNSIELTTLTGLMKWVETTSAQLGPENTKTILDVTEMMGNIPEDLKLTLDKFVPPNGHTEPQEQVSSRTYLNCLKELAKLLGQTNVGDFVAVHVVTHGLSAMTGGEKYG